MLTQDWLREKNIYQKNGGYSDSIRVETFLTEMKSLQGKLWL